MFAERRRFGKRSGACRAQLDANEEAERPRSSRGRRKLVISRLSQRVGKRKAGRKERVAHIEIRSVPLSPTAGGTAPFPVQFVHVSEPKPGAKPWFLTVAAVEMQVVDWRALRWRIAR